MVNVIAIYDYQLNKCVIELFKLIDEGNMQEAKILFNKLKYKSDITKYLKKDIYYIENYFKEKSYMDSISNLSDDSKFKNRVDFAFQLLEEKDYEQALKIFLNTYSIDKQPIFLYYIGICYMNLDNDDLAIRNLNKYAQYGGYKLEDCYSKLIEIYNKKIETEKNNQQSYVFTISTYEKEIENIKQGITAIKRIRQGKIVGNQEKCAREIDYEEEKDIIELINLGKINDVSTAFDDSESLRKINILALLYVNGFEKTADKLLKQNREELKQECREYYNLLNKNKSLYCAKAKFKS